MTSLEQAVSDAISEGAGSHRAPAALVKTGEAVWPQTPRETTSEEKAETGLRHVCTHGSQRAGKTQRGGLEPQEGPGTLTSDAQPHTCETPGRLFKPLSGSFDKPRTSAQGRSLAWGTKTPFPRNPHTAGGGDRPSSRETGDGPGKARSPPCEAGRVRDTQPLPGQPRPISAGGRRPSFPSA